MQNFHPLFVHFPVALLLTSAVAALWAQASKRPGAHLVARVLLWIGTLAAAAAVITGFLASQSVAPVRGAHDVIEDHERYAYILLGLSALLSAWAVVSRRRSGAPPAPAALWPLGQVALLVLLVLTAKEGGELVHELGVGTKLTAPGGPLYDPSAREGVEGSSNAPRPTGKDFR